MSENNFSLRVGAIPEPADLIPTTFTSTALSVCGLITGTLLADAAGTTPDLSLLTGLGTALFLSLGRNIETAQERRGCILKQGGITILEPWEDQTSTSGIDNELTKTYKKALNDESCLVERHQSEQYNIHVIYNDDPDVIKTKINKIARYLGLEPQQIMFLPVWGKGSSAILAHRPAEEWEQNPVRFDKNAVIKDSMTLQAGRSIKGETILYDRKVYPHALFAGETGAGKTEAMVADMYAARATGLNPRVFVIDPKNTPALKRIKGTTYTNDAAHGIELMQQIVALCEERIDRYSSVDCDNYWQYRKKHNPQEQPICLYVDEVAELVSPDVLDDSKEAKKLAQKALSIITRLVQKYRSAGLFVSLGMQHPLAEVLSTNVRNNLGIRIILSVADHKAAGVAGVQGAENLPMMGGMIVKQGKSLTYGRGVYLSAE